MTASSHARALVRRRRGLAIVIAQDQNAWLKMGRGDTWVAQHALDILGGVSLFDVARARAYARELIALEDEHAAFTDWTMARGKGPDNREPGAFVRDEYRTYSGPIGEGLVGRGWRDDGERDDGRTYWLASRPGVGGWPGKLAREYADEMTDGCCGSWRRDVFVHDPGPCDDCHERYHRFRRAPQGRSLARVGRRLLEALEGQPDECQTCAGEGLQREDIRPKVDDLTEQPERIEANVAWHRARWDRVLESRTFDDAGYTVDMRLRCSRRCPDCHGTGHNLVGYLPEVEVTPAMRWRVADSFEAGTDREIVRHPQWWDGLGLGLGEFPVTRVVPRGEHRDEAGLALDLSPRACAKTLAVGLDIPPLDERISLRGWQPRFKRPRFRYFLPRWRRGELLHAQQRRERAAHRDAAERFDAYSRGVVGATDMRTA